MKAALSTEQVRALLGQPTTTVSNAGLILNLSRNATYEAVARGDIPSMRVGKRILVLTAPLCRKLGIEQQVAA